MCTHLQLLEYHDLDTSAALECYKAAEQFENGRTNLKILAPLARLLLLSGDLQLALITYTRAVVICADALSMCLLKARHARGRGRGNVREIDGGGGGGRLLAERHGAMLEVEELRVLHSGLLVGYGDVLRAKGLWNEAEDAYLNVLEVLPNDVPAQLGLLFTLLDCGQDADTAQILMTRLIDADVRYVAQQVEQVTCWNLQYAI